MSLKLNIKSAAKKSVNRPESAAATQATRLRELMLKMDSLKAEIDEAKEDLLTVVNTERESRVRKGEEVMSINAPTLDGNRVMVVYAEKFKTLDEDNTLPLRAAFGDKFNLVVDEIEALNFREGVKLAGLEAAIGKEALDKLQGFLEVKKGVSPKKGVFKEVSRMFREGDVQRGEDLLVFLDATTYAPTVRAK